MDFATSHEYGPMARRANYDDRLLRIKREARQRPTSPILHLPQIIHHSFYQTSRQRNRLQEIRTPLLQLHLNLLSNIIRVQSDKTLLEFEELSLEGWQRIRSKCRDNIHICRTLRPDSKRDGIRMLEKRILDTRRAEFFPCEFKVTLVNRLEIASHSIVSLGAFTNQVGKCDGPVVRIRVGAEPVFQLQFGLWKEHL